MICLCRQVSRCLGGRAAGARAISFCSECGAFCGSSAPTSARFAVIFVEVRTEIWNGGFPSRKRHTSRPVTRAHARAGDAWRGIHDKLPGPGRRRARFRARAHVPARAKPVGKCAPTRRPKTFSQHPISTITLTTGAVRETDGPAGCVADDSQARRGGGHRRGNLLSHIPGYRYHRLPRQRRSARARSGNGGTRESADDKAL
jgi:hypothetical protein